MSNPPANNKTVNNKPVDVIYDGGLKSATWKNDGENGPYFSTKLSKIYTDDDGNYQETYNFSSNDLLRIGELARETHHRNIDRYQQIAQNRREQTQQEQQPPRQAEQQAAKQPNDSPDSYQRRRKSQTPRSRQQRNRKRNNQY